MERSVSLRRACRIAGISVTQPSTWAKAHLIDAHAEGSRFPLERVLRLVLLAELRTPMRSSAAKMKRAIDALVPAPDPAQAAECDVVWDVDALTARWANSPGHLRVLLTEDGHPGPYLVIPMAAKLRRAVTAFGEGDEADEDEDPQVSA